MSLKEKIILILVGIFMIYGIVDYAIQYLIIFPSFLKLEHQEAEQNLQRTVNAIEREIFHLDALCHDWSSWDDTYHFVLSHSEDYKKSNLVPSLFSNNQINLFYIYDLKGRIIWGEARDLTTLKLIELADFPAKGLNENHPLLFHRLDKEPLGQMTVKGIFTTTQGNMLVASRPVLTSNEQGPIRGTLIMGRFLTSQLIETLAKQTQVSFNVLQSQEFFATVKTSTPLSLDEESDEPIMMVDEDQDHLLIYKKIFNLNKKIAFFIKIEIPRIVVAKGSTALRYALISILGSDLIIIIVMLMFLNHTVVYPLKRLNRHLLSVEKDTNLSVRIGMTRQDEIGTLAREFDRMLEQIEKQTMELERVNQELRKDIFRRQQVESALKMANKELERMVMLDGLTQIANRRYLDQYLEQEWKQLRREQKPIALIMCDIDCFKLYNDTYGHPLGDDCLQTVAKTLDYFLSLKQFNYLVARYGGEEFSIVLPNITAEEAKKLAESLRIQIRQLEMVHVCSPVDQYVTLSLGVASMMPTLELSLEILIALADKALYEAKRQGRNRVILKTEKNVTEVLDYQ